MAKNISIYPGAGMDRVFDMNPGAGRSKRINTACDRYAEILRRTELPAMTEAEMNALRDVLNGVWLEPADSIRGALWLEAEDAMPDGLDEKWQVNGPALIEKLRGLTYPQEVALVEAIEGWWGKRMNSNNASPS